MEIYNKGQEVRVRPGFNSLYSVRSPEPHWGRSLSKSPGLSPENARFDPKTKNLKIRIY